MEVGKGNVAFPEGDSFPLHVSVFMGRVYGFYV